MAKILLPQNVADAMESCWNYIQTTDDFNKPKYIILNDWTKISTCCTEEAAILKTYAEQNPLDYMKALVNGYDIEFDKNMLINHNGISLYFSDEIKKGNYTDNYPIEIQLGSAYNYFSIEEAKAISDDINVLIQELKKVRSDI